MASQGEASHEGDDDLLRWQNESKAADEALTCACFLGLNDVAEFLLAQGVDPCADADEAHLARGETQLAQYAVVGTAVGSAMNEPKPHHVEIIAELLHAGAQVSRVHAAGAR